MDLLKKENSSGSFRERLWSNITSFKKKRDTKLDQSLSPSGAQAVSPSNKKQTQSKMVVSGQDFNHNGNNTQIHYEITGIKDNYFESVALADKTSEVKDRDTPV